MLNENRTQELLENCLEYMEMLEKHESIEEKINFYKNTIGMSDTEIKYFCLDEE